jgi:hypothetical protein
MIERCRTTAMVATTIDVEKRQPRLEAWKSVALFGGGTAIFLWQLRHPIIRLEWPIANELLGLAFGLSLPWLTAAAIFRLGRWWSKTVALISIIPLLLYSAVFLLGSLITGFSYKNGRNLFFDQFAETHWKGSRVCFYRINGGATTDFGVEIRQERRLIPGVLLVRQLDDFYHCYSLDATSTDEGITLRDGRYACAGFREQHRDYRLKPFLYF